MTRKPQKSTEATSLQPPSSAPGGLGEVSTAVPSGRAAAAAVAGIVTAWIAAGSSGLVVRPLQHVLAWSGMAFVLIAGWPRRGLKSAERAVLGGALVAGLVLTVPDLAVSNVAALALVLAAVGWTARGPDAPALAIAAYAVGVLSLYRLAIVAIPAVWLASNALGEALGSAAGAICGKPLRIGASFAGLDFLVLVAAWYAGWLQAIQPPRRIGASYGAAAIVLGHFCYLVLLAHTHDLLALIPKAPAVEPPAYQSDLYVPPPWYWGDALRTLLPWNMPLAAVAIHAATIAGMLRCARWRPNMLPSEPAAQGRTPGGTEPRSASKAAWIGLGAAVAAVAMPLCTVLSTAKTDLTGRKIVACEHGYLDWEKPKHGVYGEESAGMYGMLPILVESLGARFVRIPSVMSPELDSADLLVVIHPTQSWSEAELERVWDYVRAGGAMLVLAEPRIHEEDLSSSFDQLLEPIGLEVRFDTALPATPHWQHGVYDVLHPTALGASDATNAFSLSESSSIVLRWPGRPILVGRWGWSDPGSDAVLTRVHRLEPGERLGDLVLAAEQPVGRGRVIVLADAGSFKNLGLSASYQFAGRLLSYLAARSPSPHAAWRQAAGLAACLLLMGLWGWKIEAGRVATGILLLVMALGAATSVTAAPDPVLPDGRTASPNFVACIDASHAEAFSYEPWADEGVAGLQLTLMRNGYLPLLMRHWNAEQLDRAALLILIAPARAFSRAERAAIRDFLERGGIVLVMAGANHAGPVQPLLAEFGLAVPRSPLPAADPRREPEPMGYFRTPYLDTGQYKAYVNLYAGWPVECPGPDTEVLVYGFDDRPVVAAAHVGSGKLIVIGDTCFAMNKNLEAREEEPPQEFVENGYFWRWLLAELRGEEWTPPAPKAKPTPPTETEDDMPDPNDRRSAAGRLRHVPRGAAGESGVLGCSPGRAVVDRQDRRGIGFEAHFSDRPTQTTHDPSPVSMRSPTARRPAGKRLGQSGNPASGSKEVGP